jgi:Kef-type K+ transport system membrane component KefB
MVNGFLFDIAIMIGIATAGAYLLGMLRQPLIPAYIITGLVIGPYGLCDRPLRAWACDRP